MEALLSSGLCGSCAFAATANDPELPLNAPNGDFCDAKTEKAVDVAGFKAGTGAVVEPNDDFPNAGVPNGLGDPKVGVVDGTLVGVVCTEEGELKPAELPAVDFGLEKGDEEPEDENAPNP